MGNETLLLDRKFQSKQLTKLKQRQSSAQYTDSRIISELLEQVDKLNIDSKQSKDAAAKSKRELKGVCAKRDEVLKCVSHMDTDTVLQTEQLEAALANLSDPYFLLGRVKKGVRSKVSMCRLSTNFCMLHFIFLSLCFTLLFYVSVVVFKYIPTYP